MSQGPTFSASAGDGQTASRLEKERGALFARSEEAKRKLANEKYVSKAPAEVVAETRDRAARCGERIASLEASLARL